MFSKNTSRLHFIIFLYLPVSIAAEKSSPIYGCVIQLSLCCIGTSDYGAIADLPVQLDLCSYSCIALYCSTGSKGVLEISCQGGSTCFGISSDLY